MLKLRVREYTPDGVRGRVLPTVKGTISVTHQLNGTPVLRFALSTRSAGKMPDDGFAVGVEYSVGGGRFEPLPEHDRFIMSEDSGDDADQSKTVTYSGESYLSWLLAHTYVHWSSRAKNGVRGVNGPAGYHMRALIEEAKARGWGAQMGYDFTNAKDSANVSWAPADTVKLEWRLLTPVSTMLESMVDGGMCDWTVHGMTLSLYRYGTLGTDRTELVLGGPRMERIPVKSDVSHIFTHLTVVPEKAKNWLYLTNAGAPSKWGRLEATMTQSGVKTHVEATKLAQPTLAEGRTATREESYEWTPAVGDLTPWRDFQVGDMVTARARGGSKPRRVIGVVVREQAESVTVRAIVGEKIGTTQARILSRVGSASVGGVIGGTGSSFPGATGPSPVEPDRPDALMVTSNTGSWLEDYTARSTVVLGWQAVTHDIDGGETDVVEYEVWSRPPSGELALDTIVTASAEPSATITSWAPGVSRLVAVRAKTEEGTYSEFSLELLVTPAVPTSVVPKAPENLTVVSNTGAFTSSGPVATIVLAWDAVTESTDDAAITVDEYELWSDAPITRVSGLSGQVMLGSLASSEFRVRARTPAGVWGDLSLPIGVTGAEPAMIAHEPTAPMLRTGYGNVSALWDGTYVDENPTGEHSVWIEARLDEDDWAPQGSALTGAGSVLITVGGIGDTVEVRVVAYDQLGRETGVSDVATIQVEAVDGASIAVDTLDGNRLRAGTVMVDHLEPNIGSTLNLTANDSIVLMAGRQDSLETGLSETNADLAAQQAVFVVIETGAEVRSVDSASVTRIEPSEISMLQGGVKLFRVKDSQVIANEIITSRAQLANHVVEKSGATRTVFRAL